MRAVAVAALTAVALALALASGLAGPATAQPRTTALGFDHLVHDGRITVLGKPSLACNACHATTASGALVGRPGHGACIGACHAPMAPAALSGPASEAQLQVCGTCHAPADLANPRPAVAFPPYTIEPDFPLTISHATHAAAGCEACHAVSGKPAGTRAPAPGKPRPHARCIGCHDGKGAADAMTSCTSCHVAAYGANALPRLVRGPLAVGAAFAHGKHAARKPAAAVACTTCHRAIAAADGLELPAPSAADCTTAGCHDGAAAFPITERCTSCHTSAPAGPHVVARPDARFSHATHSGRLAIDGCVTCHTLDGRGDPRSSGHQACAGCHASDFGSPTPIRCGACHAGSEPWRKLVADQLPPPRSEFGARMNHAAHADVACTRCHTLDTATRELRPPRGHAACAGSGCHAATTGPPPKLDACATCHAVGLEATRTRARLEAPWSVRSRFRHAAHAIDDTGAPVPCVVCHDAVVRSTDAASIAAPAKPTCTPCHEGKRAFKMTGHGCARCHGT